jgi:8-oxo-dGTP diphosphatase
MKLTAMTNITEFNLRMYALIINEKKQILLSDEMFQKVPMTKFPGGGLHLGEGLLDGLQRESREEMNQELKNIKLFHVTDKFVPTIFFKNKQLIAIYYLAELSDPNKLEVSDVPFDFDGDEDGTQSFRWVSIDELKEADFTFDTDKELVRKLKNEL